MKTDTSKCCEHGVRYDAICDLCSGVFEHDQDGDIKRQLACDLLEAVGSAADSYCNCGAVRGVSEHRPSCKAVSADLAEKRFLARCEKLGIHLFSGQRVQPKR